MSTVQDARSVDDVAAGGAEEHVLTTTAGRRIGYLARGPKDGDPVIYLHGAPGSRREQMLIPGRILQRSGIRLVSLDRPGYGKTDPLDGDRLARTRDVLAVADALGIRRFALLAVSSGGSYALALAAASPERVERVVLGSAQMPYDDEGTISGLQPQQRALVPILRRGRNRDVESAMRAARDEMIKDPIVALEPNMSTLSDQERAWYEQPTTRDIFIDDVREGLSQSHEGFLADLLAWPQPFEIDIGNISCPVNALHGTADDWEPLPNLRRALSHVADTEMILLDGLNHLGPLMRPALLLSLAAGDR
jgi:pimeloyl-ACP methyl ester carboxylesterase